MKNRLEIINYKSCKMDPITICIIASVVVCTWLYSVYRMRNRAESEGKQLKVSLIGNTFSDS